jgi:hypothetical protein
VWRVPRKNSATLGYVATVILLRRMPSDDTAAAFQWWFGRLHFDHAQPHDPSTSFTENKWLAKLPQANQPGAVAAQLKR